ncbi:glycosyltransferase family 2 protein [Candidatus Bathyarchaeota archaeon]|nr:MAG: glycosyltransferase family 2 protein [Candidatus Bathyarchaeota archaeon]
MYLALIPAFNEEKSIVNIIKETKKYVDRVVVVDDSSTDRTGKLARDSGATVLQHSENQGVGAAMITGIIYAKKLKPDIVVILDADGQHRPKDIPRLMQPIIEGKAGLVLGSRFLQRSPDNMSAIKKYGNRFLTFMINVLVGTRLTDAQTGFRAFSRKALLALSLRSKFTYTQEMLLILCLKGYRCFEIPIQVNSRKYGNSKVASNIVGYALRSLIIIFSTYLLLRTRR